MVFRYVYSMGRELFQSLNNIMTIDPKNVQFFCAEWFWKKQINSYALQVEPERFKHKDKILIDYNEALRIEQIRNEFFVRVDELLRREES